VKFQAIVDVVL